jgi:TRAP-type C4-dicarboxylate transport system permease small subunit
MRTALQDLDGAWLSDEVFLHISGRCIRAWVYACVPVGGAVMVIYALRDFILSTRTSNPNQEIDHNAV